MAWKVPVLSGPRVRCVDSEHPHPQWELVAVAAEFAQGDGQVGGRPHGQLAVGAALPVGGLEDPLPESACRLVLTQPVDDDGQVELGPGRPGLRRVHSARFCSESEVVRTRSASRSWPASRSVRPNWSMASKVAGSDSP